jgi:glycosyltransferase involved in cell wall biosynthesis
MTETNTKLKILAVPANTGGCSYYRIIMPMQKLVEHFPNEVEVRFNENPLGATKSDDGRIGPPPPDFVPEDIQWADIVFTQNISNFGGPYTLEVLKTAKELGKFFIYDTDDLLTDLYKGHRLYDLYIDNGLSELTKVIYANSDLVTVTQQKFAERVAPFVRHNLAVVRNAIDYNLPCWNLPKQKPVKKSICRIGWVGGIHHEEDVKEFKGVALGLNAKVGPENIWWSLFGRPPMGEGLPRDWQQDVWDNYTKIITGGMKHRNFGVYTARPSHDYGGFYTAVDLNIAPLQFNNFNDSKSEIKLMESGRYGIPLIASDVGCYSDIIVNGETGFLIPKDNPRSTWVKTLSKAVKDRKLRAEMGKNLKSITDDLYDINKQIVHRFNLYKEIYDKWKNQNT